MTIELTKKNGHFNIKEKYSELKDTLEDAIQQNKKALGKFKRMAESAAYDSGEKIKDAVIDADRTVRKNPWPYLAGATACAMLLGFILGRKK